MKTKHATREAWLNAAVAHLAKEFTQPVPKKLRVSCGFPSRNALGAKRQRIGECWSDKASDGKVFEIFISPVLAKPLPVLETLIHEIVHAVVGLECGHKGAFKTVATAIGLEGKMTATHAGAALASRLGGVAKLLGPYPHDHLNGMTNGKPKDVCRLVKAECPDCGYVIRTTRKWIDESGLPTCPCGSEFQEPEGDE